MAVVVAHPDDETIGCGAHLGSGVAYLVVVTDGAPRDLADARAKGFADAVSYAEARRRELEAALNIAGLPADRLHCLRVPDQQAAREMPRIARRLAALLTDRPVDAVVTHAYEGGHPDHDATAFAAHAAAALLARSGRMMPIIQMPYYRAEGGGTAYQCFPDGEADAAIVVALPPASELLKRRMIAAYETQQAMLLPFSTMEERFRRAPAYDFAVLPNGGNLLYERYAWGLKGAEWRELAPAALRALGLEGGPC